MAAPMLFMKIDVEGLVVTGTAENKKFREQIALDGASWSVGAKDSKALPGNKVLAKVEPQFLVIDKSFDRASSSLAQAMLDRKKVRKATITLLNGEFVDAEGGRPELTVVTIVNGFVEAIDLSTSKSGKAAIEVKETLRLSFESIRIEYFPGDMTKLGRGAAIPVTLDVSSAKRK